MIGNSSPRLFRGGLTAQVAAAVVLAASLLGPACVHRPASSPARGDFDPSDSWFWRQRAGSDGIVPVNALSRALAEARAAGLRESTGSWVPAGPNNVGGRISSLARDPNDANHLWLGAADGGVFTSFDGGTSWAPRFDSQTALSIGSIAVHPADSSIVYVGTGEEGGGGWSYDGEGVFKTTNGGASWTSLGLGEVRRIAKLAIDPADPNRLFVAAGGGVFNKDANRGVYRSTNGGASWQKVLYIADDTGASDVAIDPVTPSRVFAAMWQRNRAGNSNYFGGVNSAIYRSADGGATWTKLTTGLPAGSLGRIGLAIARSNPQVVYAIIYQAPGTLLGIWRSINGGDSWVKTSNSSLPLFFSSYGYYFGQIRVHPTNPNTVFALDLSIFRSTDGGVNFFPIGSSIHVDQHDLIVESSGRMLSANDGGFYRSLDNGASWTHAENIPITQFYDLCVDRLQPLRRFGGAQDNGTLRTTTGGLTDWQEVIDGDGMQCEVDPSDSSRVYGESQYGDIDRSVDGGNSFVSATTGIDAADRKNWVTPITLDPLVPSILYTGTQRVYRSTDGAVSWSSVSGDLTNGPTAGSEMQDPASGSSADASSASATIGGAPQAGQDHSQKPITGTITALGVSPVDDRIVWAGTDDGNVWVSENSAASWSQVNPPGPAYWVTEIAPDPFDGRAAYLTVTGFRSADRLPYIRTTRDLGTTWRDLSGNLPQVPLNSVVPDPAWRGRLFLGSDIGVHRSDDGGASWSFMSSGMPYVVVQDLVLHGPSRTLFAGTHARSMYSFDLGQLPIPDGDGDGVDNNADCALDDPGAFALPGEVTPLTAYRGNGGSALLTWPSLASSAGPGTVYDLARGDLAGLRTSGTGGSASQGCALTVTSATDSDLPAPASGFYYMVRGKNACGAGIWGRDSGGIERASPACP